MVFLLFTTPYVMFESKKLKFLLLIRRKEQIEPKKLQLAAKKKFPRVQRISHVFFAVGHPLCDVVLFLLDLFLPSDMQQKGVLLLAEQLAAFYAALKLHLILILRKTKKRHDLHCSLFNTVVHEGKESVSLQICSENFSKT